MLTPQLPAIREIRELGSVGTSAYVAIGVQTGATVSGYRLEVTAAAPPTLSVDVAHAGP